MAYAGWAQSVFFISDLKSFENYGPPTPAPTPISERVKGEMEVERELFDTGEVPETSSRLRLRNMRVLLVLRESPKKFRSSLIVAQ